MSVHAWDYWIVLILDDIDGLMQERRKSIANALELHLTCTKPSIWFICILYHCLTSICTCRWHIPERQKWTPKSRVHPKNYACGWPYVWFCCPLPTELRVAYMNVCSLFFFIHSSVCPSGCHTLWFPCISGQTAHRIDLKLGEYIHYGHPLVWLTFAHALIGWAVSVHMQKNHWSEWAQIWWAKSLWASLDLNNFWLCFIAFPPFLGL